MSISISVMNTSKEMGETAFERCGINKNSKNKVSFMSALPTASVLSDTSVGANVNSIAYPLTDNKLSSAGVGRAGQLSVGFDRMSGISLNSKGYTPRNKEREKIQVSS